MHSQPRFFLNGKKSGIEKTMKETFFLKIFPTVIINDTVKSLYSVFKYYQLCFCRRDSWKWFGCVKGIGV